jgi:Protein phosphatase 2C
MGTYLSTPKTDKESGAIRDVPDHSTFCGGAALPRHAVLRFASRARRVLCRLLQSPNYQARCSLAENGSGKGVQYAMCGMQGWRKTMEDAHIAHTAVNGQEDMSVFAIFDGHGGPEVAKFCAKYMVPELVKLTSFGKGDFDSALKDAFHRMDAMLMDEQHATELASVRFLLSFCLATFAAVHSKCVLPIACEARHDGAFLLSANGPHDNNHASATCAECCCSSLRAQCHAAPSRRCAQDAELYTSLGRVFVTNVRTELIRWCRWHNQAHYNMWRQVAVRIIQVTREQ